MGDDIFGIMLGLAVGSRMDDDSGGKGTYYCILGRSRSFPAALEEHTS